jgi:hypothetical protein
VVASTVRTYDLGDRATGLVADENDWNKTGPQIITPKRKAWGEVIGVFAAPTAVLIRTDAGETYCIRVDK